MNNKQKLMQARLAIEDFYKRTNELDTSLNLAYARINQVLEDL